MSEFDPSATQADVFSGIAADLAAAGFEHPHEIGRGGFGVVFRCEQRNLGRTVAVKVLSAVVDDDNYERFRREEYVMGRLSGHPNIATVHQVGSIAGGRPFIVMPYYRLDSLEKRIRQEGACEWAWAVRVGVKLAGALETAHRFGVLHRDVKPANVLLTDYGEPQLTDFGIARIAGGFETGTGYFAGSLAYTAPEVLGGAPATVVSDVYSLGATLFSLVSGRGAFERKQGEEVIAQFLRIGTQDIPDLREIGIPDDLSQVIERAMSRDPAARLATAAAFGDALRTVQRQHGIVADEMAISSETIGAEPYPTSPVAVVDSHHRRHLGGRLQLPVPLTSFVGRRHEVRDIELLVRGGARLTTLTGPGGVGKSRLALEVAARLNSEFGGDVQLVDLGKVLEADNLIDAFVDALELGDLPTELGQPAHALAGRLAESMGTRPTLIVLDNCEHLIAECGPLVEELLRTVAGLRMLVTSQQVLGIAGEHIFPVLPMSLQGAPDGESEAVELFLDRAEAAVPNFAPAEADRADVARLCAELDGMPLAIELAAARLRTFGVGELLQVIQDRFRLLVTGSSAVEPRHRTLQALVDWSYRLLTPDEREIWSAVSLFADEFTAQAAVEVGAGQDRSVPDVHVALASLVDKSMLMSTPRNGVHYYRLLVTLREYARQRLAESPVREVITTRYIDRYLRIAEDFDRNWFSSHQVTAFHTVQAERENLRAALAYSDCDGDLSTAGAEIVTSLHYYWLASSTLAEARRWLAAAIDSPRVDPAAKVHALWSSALIAMVQNDIAGSEHHARQALDRASAIGDKVGEGFARLALGLVALFHDDLRRGFAEYESALECQRDAQNPQGIVATIPGLLTTLAQQDRESQAPELWHEAVALCVEAGEQWNLAYLRFSHAYHAYTIGDLDGALHDAQRTLWLSRPFADRILLAWVLEMLSWIAAQRKEFEFAARLRGAAAASWAAGDASMIGYGTMTEHRRQSDIIVRAALGAERADELIDLGRRTPGDAMVAEVLGEFEPDPAARAARRSDT